MFLKFVFPLLLLFSFYDMPSDAQKKKEVSFTFFSNEFEKLNRNL